MFIPAHADKLWMYPLLYIFPPVTCDAGPYSHLWSSCLWSSPPRSPAGSTLIVFQEVILNPENWTRHQQWKPQFCTEYSVSLCLSGQSMCHRSLEHLTKSFFLVRMMRSNPPSRCVRVQRVLFFLLTITLTLSLKGQGKANTKRPVLSAFHHSWLDVCNKVSLSFGQHSTCLCIAS